MLAPIKSKVLIELIEVSKTTSSGIILAAPNPDDFNKATIIAIGDKVTDVNVGDIVLPNWNQAIETKYDDDHKYYIIDEKDIVLVIVNGDSSFVQVEESESTDNPKEISLTSNSTFQGTQGPQ
jgi:co-chaperonin GroES (HSP10)